MTIYVLLVAHFVADFLAQSDWMAVNKSKRWDALALHVGAYIGAAGFIVAIFQPPSPWPYTTAKMFGVWLLVNALAHFVQDAVTSRITSRLWFFRREDGIWAQAEYAYPKHGRTLVNPWTPIDGTRHWFFVAIGADQLLHYGTLFVTAHWWLQ